MTSWVRQRVFPWKVACSTLAGFAIGWNMDSFCTIEGVSMLPTLKEKECIFFLPSSLLIPLQSLTGKRAIKPGDVVVAKISPTLSVCKRVTRVCDTWDEVQTWETEAFTPIDEYFHRLETDSNVPLPRQFQWEEARLRIAHPTGWMWLEGDNTQDSLDSRHCGAIPTDCLRGLVVATIYPHPSRVRRITSSPVI